MLYQVDKGEALAGGNDPLVMAELQKILAFERARLTCDASTAVVVAKACEGLEAQLAFR